MTPKFPSKLLLLGEYTIIKNSQALAIPFSTYGGYFQYGGDALDLMDLCDYLEKLQEERGLLCVLDIVAFRRALQKGLSFESSIPTGYGVGSSGAVCAAVYQVFCQNKEEIDGDLLQLKKVLAQIENFFHGASSGIDPLVSYLQKSVWIKSKMELERLPENHFDRPATSAGTLFLIDTQIPRETAPLVNLFHEKYKQPDFQNQIQSQLIPIVNQAILNLIQKEGQKVFEAFHEISVLQQQLFREMIPDAFIGLWEEGLQSDFYKLKLCGAGGGGFLLGMTTDFEKLEQQLLAYSVHSVVDL